MNILMAPEPQVVYLNKILVGSNHILILVFRIVSNKCSKCTILYTT